MAQIEMSKAAVVVLLYLDRLKMLRMKVKQMVSRTALNKRLVQHQVALHQVVQTPIQVVRAPIQRTAHQKAQTPIPIVLPPLVQANLASVQVGPLVAARPPRKFEKGA